MLDSDSSPRRDRSPAWARRLVSAVVLLGALVATATSARAALCNLTGTNVTLSTACTLEGGEYFITGDLVISAAVTASSDTGTSPGPVVINAANITVTGTGSVIATSHGYAAATGPGYTASPLSGAGHGGLAASAAGAVYGSVTGPTHFGSGAVGAVGGGAIVLRTGGGSTGAVTINGTVAANGQSNTGACANDGGAGGSVWIQTYTLGGTGSIQAKGGTACTSHQAGGGGRIAFQYAALAASTTAVANASASAGAGGAGTIYVESTASGSLVASLVVDNANVAGSYTMMAGGSETYDQLTVRNGGKLRVPSGGGLTLRSGGTITGGGTTTPLLEVMAGGTFTTESAASIANLNVGVYGTIASPKLTLTTSYFTMGGAFAWGFGELVIGASATLAQQGTTTLALGALTVQSGGVVTHLDNATDRLNAVDVSADTVTIQSGGVVAVDNLGYDAGLGPGRATLASSSAGHGGLGSGTGGGTVYGDLRHPTTMGSGGWSGGNGGGTVKLTTAGTLTVNGTISANGAATSTANAGSGAGGSIWLEAATLVGTGTVSANGAGHTAAGNNSAAGGGRIAVYYGTDSSSLISTAGKLQAYGGNTNLSGGAGTIYLKSTAAPNGSLVVDGANRTGLTYTPYYDAGGASAQTFDSVTLRNGARYRVTDWSTLEIASGGALTGGGTARPTLTVDAFGQFAAPSSTMTLSNLDVTLSGGWGNTSSLTLTNATFNHSGGFSPSLASLTVGTGGAFNQLVAGQFSIPTIALQNTGAYRVGTGSTLVLDASLAGTGATPTMQVDAGGTLSASTAVTLSGITFTVAGALAGGDITLASTMNLSGTLADGFGILRIASGGVLEQRSTSTLVLDDLEIASGGTYRSGTNTTAKVAEVNVRARIATVAGTITVNGLGYAANNGTGSSGAGAAHGGLGGSDTGTAYGSITAPVDLGSGSGWVSGGGSVRLDLTERLTVTSGGLITANGSSYGSSCGGDAGAGGSIYITTAALSLANTADRITANGGSATYGCGGEQGGGAGRIAVKYASLDAGTDPYAASVIAARSYGNIMGGAGTIYLESTTAHTRDLIIDGRLTGVGALAASTPVVSATETFDNVYLRGGAVWLVPNTKTAVVTTAITGSATGSRPRVTIATGGRVDFPSANASISNLDVLHDGTVGTVTSLSLVNSYYRWAGAFAAGLAGSLTVGSGATFEQDNATTLTLDTLDVQASGIYQSGANTTTKRYEVNVRARTATVAGTITVNGLGYAANNGTGSSGAGAAHGGLGGSETGTPYGSITAPVDLGSGSGWVSGGGSVRLDLTERLTVTSSGLITANGSSYGASCGGDAGAGGSIYITTAALSLANTADRITANGGSATYGCNGEQGGGAGRIAIKYASLDAGTDPYAASVIAARSYGNIMGGAGTIYLESTTAHTRDLIIDGRLTGVGALAASTPVVSATETFDSVYLRGGAIWLVPNTKTAVVTTAITGSATGSRPRVTIATGGRVDFPSANASISNLDVLHDGTVGTVTSLSLANSYYRWTGAFAAGLSGALTIGSGATFEQDNTTTLTPDTLNVQASGTYQSGTNTTTKRYEVNVRARTATVAGTITVNGLGYAANNGTGSSSVGAAHGGYGGSETGTPYGSVTAPVDLGSGSGWVSGGGSVRLDLTERLTVTSTGLITANGSSYGLTCGGDAGAGGSIYITTAALSLSNTADRITANGGAATYGCIGEQGGGGGRVALEYASLDPGTDPYTASIIAARAYGSNVGGAGTIYLKDRTAGTRGLIVDPRLTSAYGANTALAGTLLTIDRLVLRGGARLRVAAGQTLAFPAAAGTFSTAGTLRSQIQVDAGGSLALPQTTSLSAFDLSVQGRLTQVSDLTLANTTVVYQPDTVRTLDKLTLGASGTLELRGTGIFPVGTLQVQSGGILTHTAGGGAESNKIFVSASAVDIAAGGSINANGKGYTSAVAGTGYGTSGTTAGGGGHGSAGGASSGSIAGGGTYGSSAAPASYGSVGGTDTDNGAAGGAGGGVVKLVVCGPLTVNGTLSANGSAGASNQAGGGAGGSVYVAASALSGSGTISANGGNGAGVGGAGGGGGGGGRVAVYAGSSTFSASSITATGGARGSTTAQAGGNTVVVNGAAESGAGACPVGGCGTGTCAGVWRPDLLQCDYAGTNTVACDDADLCTTGTTCQAGTCGSGSAVSCDDNNTCTADSCAPSVGCQHNGAPRDGTACNDGNACTTVDRCAAGACAGSVPPACDDGNACTDTTCDPAVGCTYPPLTGTACSDGDACTGSDVCQTGTCGGRHLEVEGCFSHFPGPPVIGPTVEFGAVRGSSVSVDLTSHENDFEVGTQSDTNGLTWSIDGYDPTLVEVAFDAATEILTVTPKDPAAPLETTLRLTLTDPTGLTDTALARATNKVPDYHLALTATPESADLFGDRVTLSATLTSPTGRSLAWQLIDFEQLTGDGRLTTPLSATDATGVATVGYVSGATPGTSTFRATLALPSGEAYTADLELPVTAPPRDAAVFVLDITFHDPATGLAVDPGDRHTVVAGEPLEVHARVRNLGAESTPALAVDVASARIAGTTLTPFTTLRSLTTAPIPPGGSEVLTFTESFGEVGFHLLQVSVDPLDAFADESDESNNLATQGLWIGDMAASPFDVIVAQCDFTGITGGEAELGAVIGVKGRADYGPLLAFDPDGSLGYAAVKGGLVSLSIYDDLGAATELVADGETLLPVTGDLGPYRSLHTVGDAADAAALGQFPNGLDGDAWEVPAPDAFGCYSIRACVTDGSFDGCCEVPFCVVAKGPDLLCDELELPLGTTVERAPVVGTATTIATVVRNQGDVPAVNVQAKLMAGTTQVGATQTIASLAAHASTTLTFPWTPGCNPGELAVVLDPDDRVAEAVEGNNSCSRRPADLVASEVTVTPTAGCVADVSVVFSNTGAMPRPAVGATLSLTPPTGAARTVTVDPTDGAVTATGVDLGVDGSYTIDATVDGPVSLPGTCGGAPELSELANNTARLVACRDPSAWSSAEQQGADDLTFTPRPFKYDEPVTVTARVSSVGVLPVIGNVAVKLGSDLAASLETDADATADVKLVSSSCADPIMAGASKSVSWTWTPRYRPSGGPEVRALTATVDPAGAYGLCRPVKNDTSRRDLRMNLTAGLTAASAPALGTALAFEGASLLGGNSDIQPDGEGSDVTFELVDSAATVSHHQSAALVAPTTATPERYAFSWTPTSADCSVAHPLQAARLQVDANGTYAESSESDNIATLSLPDLVVANIRRAVDGCTSRYLLDVQNAAPAPALAVGSWSARVTLTAPGAAPEVHEVGPFTGVGTFEILAGIDDGTSGAWTVAVDLDTAATSACGDVLERNESNNHLAKTFDLCPDPALAVAVGIISGPITRGTPATVSVLVENTGTSALGYDVPVALTRVGGSLADVDAEVQWLRVDCDDPLLPGATREVSWQVDLRPEDGIDGLVATLDPDDTIGDQCSHRDHVVTRPLWLDLTPWNTVLGMNYSTGRDIGGDGEAAWGEVLTLDHHVRLGGLPSGYHGLPPIFVTPGPDEGIVTARQLVRESGDVVPLADLPYAPPLPQDADLPIDFAADLCDPTDPFVRVEVMVDATEAVAEESELDNLTLRELTNLSVSGVALAPAAHQRATFSFTAAGEDIVIRKQIQVGPFMASATITRPDGSTASYPAIGPNEHMGEYAIDAAVSTYQNGFYTASVTIDPPSDVALCGAIPESDEADNTATTTVQICPYARASLAIVDPPLVGEPGTLRVTIANTGNNDLIEDVRVAVEARDAEGLLVPLALDHATQTLSLSLAHPLAAGDSATVDFLWTPDADSSRITYFRAKPTVLDTVPDNGPYANAVCTGGAYSGLNASSEPVAIGLAPGAGCEASVVFDNLQACGDSLLGVSLVRPGDGTPLAATDVESVEVQLTRVFGAWPAEPIPLDLEGAGGAWTAETPLPADATLSVVRLTARATTVEGEVCTATGAAVIAAGTPDLSLTQENLTFLALDGVPGAITRADVGQLLDLGLTVTNGADACQARDVAGDLYVELGYDRVHLGTWIAGTIDPGATVSVTLVPDPSLPSPPTEPAPGVIRWGVTAPSPWLDVFTAAITDTLVDDLDVADNAATRSLWVGAFVGSAPGISVDIQTPTATDIVTPGVATPVRVRLTGDAGEPLAPIDLARVALFAVDPATDSGLAAPIDLLAGDTYLGDGVYEAPMVIDIGAPGPSIEFVALGTLSATGATGTDTTVTTLNIGEACFGVDVSDAAEEGGAHTVDVVLSLLPGQVLGTALSVTVTDLGLGTATADDYAAFADEVVTFPAGSPDGTVITVTVTPTDDLLLEPPETAVLGLVGLQACATTHTVTIVDDDVACGCDDGNPCTDDLCPQLVGGACEHVAVPPSGTDETCDGVDDDCDLAVDDDYVPLSVTCGAPDGDCAAPGHTVCEGGAVSDDCAAFRDLVSDLGDDQCRPAATVEVAYLVVNDAAGAPVGTVRCAVTTDVGGATSTCDTEGDGVTLHIYPGLFCP